MPGNVTTSSPSTVLPASLCSAFTKAIDFPCRLNVYRSGEFQASLMTSNARRSWTLARRLPATGTAALLAFYLARGGSAQAFWFYDPLEAAGQPGSNWDASGTSTTGRYCVRFEGGITQGQQRPGRQDSTFTLREIA